MQFNLLDYVLNRLFTDKQTPAMCAGPGIRRVVFVFYPFVRRSNFDQCQILLGYVEFICFDCQLRTCLSGGYYKRLVVIVNGTRDVLVEVSRANQLIE